MPELPEVETVVRDLRPHLVGRRVASVRVGRQPLRRRWSRAWAPRLIDRRILRLDRRGKWILLVLQGDLHLVIHLGMTGRLTVTPAGQPRQPHTHFVLTLDDGTRHLRFQDVRRFGSLTLFAGRAQVDDFFHAAGLGPEPFDLQPGPWRDSLACTRRCLKAVLLDQRVVAGVGNIYADEALFEARLHPGRSADSLDAAETDRLRKAIVAVLRRAIARRGSTIRNYVGGTGLQGGYQREFRVYHQAGKPCPRCGAPIERVRLAGRSTHFCSHCQPPHPSAEARPMELAARP